MEIKIKIKSKGNLAKEEGREAGETEGEEGGWKIHTHRKVYFKCGAGWHHS